RAGEHHVDRRGLLLGCSAVARAGSPGRGSRGNRGGGHAELLLERLDQLRQLEDRHLLDLLDQLCCCGHLGLLVFFSLSLGLSLSGGLSLLRSLVWCLGSRPLIATAN